MSRADVLAVWGKPAAERTADDRDYLYYRNGCEATCGTFDVVFLENGQVVDAIVRGRGHTYAGTSSSPPSAEGKPTLPGQSGS
jgi:NifU-like protein involved in Fe-S cluster formation